VRCSDWSWCNYVSKGGLTPFYAVEAQRFDGFALGPNLSFIKDRDSPLWNAPGKRVCSPACSFRSPRKRNYLSSLNFCTGGIIATKSAVRMIDPPRV
jgi:hypothetical protein